MEKSWKEFWSNYKKEYAEPVYRTSLAPLFRIMLLDKKKEATTEAEFEELKEIEAKIEEYEAQEKELEEARAEWYKNAITAFEAYCKGED